MRLRLRWLRVQIRCRGRVNCSATKQLEAGAIAPALAFLPSLSELRTDLTSTEGASRHFRDTISHYSLLASRRLDQGSKIVSAAHESGMPYCGIPISFIVATVLTLSPLAAQTSSPRCPIAGRYSVEGYVPGGISPYRGEAIISASGTGCHMKWFPPNDSEGKGTIPITF
jgi:hypothetical protein